MRDAARDSGLYGVIRYIRPLFRGMWRSVAERLEGTGVSVATRAVLERLHDGGPQTVPEVARGLYLDRQPVQRLVDELLEMKLVERAANPAHRRSWLIQLSPAGRERFERIRAKEQRVLESVARDLAPADIEACRRVLARLAEAFPVTPGERRLP